MGVSKDASSQSQGQESLSQKIIVITALDQNSNQIEGLWYIDHEGKNRTFVLKPYDDKAKKYMDQHYASNLEKAAGLLRQAHEFAYKQ